MGTDDRNRRLPRRGLWRTLLRGGPVLVVVLVAAYFVGLLTLESPAEEGTPSTALVTPALSLPGSEQPVRSEAPGLRPQAAPVLEPETPKLLVSKLQVSKQQDANEAQGRKPQLRIEAQGELLLTDEGDRSVDDGAPEFFEELVEAISFRQVDGGALRIMVRLERSLRELVGARRGGWQPAIVFVDLDDDESTGRVLPNGWRGFDARISVVVGTQNTPDSPWDFMGLNRANEPHGSGAEVDGPTPQWRGKIVREQPVAFACSYDFQTFAAIRGRVVSWLPTDSEARSRSKCVERQIEVEIPLAWLGVTGSSRLRMATQLGESATGHPARFLPEGVLLVMDPGS